MSSFKIVKDIFVYTLLLFFLGATALFVGCGNNADVAKLKEEIAQKDEEIASLNQTIEHFTAENDEYTTESGYKVSVIGGRIIEKDDEIYIHTIKDKKGFAIWEQNGEPYSGENVLILPKSSIKADVEYKAIYSSVGFLVVHPSLGDLNTRTNADRMSFGDFMSSTNIAGNPDILMSVKYSFEAGRGFETNLTSSNIIQLEADEIASATGDGGINFVDFYVNSNYGSVWLVKLYIKDDIDPYINTTDEESSTFNPDEDNVTVFVMEKITLGENNFLNRCFSIQNQKTENLESKTFSLRIKTVA